MAGDDLTTQQDEAQAVIQQDRRRARELYRILQPCDLPRSVGSGQTAGNPSKLREALEPYIQLACVRCNIPRAAITLLDDRSIFYMAETSQNSTSEDNDLVLVDRGSMPKSGKLCEFAVQLPPKAEGYALFEVNDLSKDARFANEAYVTGGSRLRYYAGTPLTTARGISIGTLCLMDSRPRESLTHIQVAALGWLADLITGYLVMYREALDGRRSKIMSNGMDRFLQGRQTSKSHHGSSGGSEGIPTVTVPDNSLQDSAKPPPIEAASSPIKLERRPMEERTENGHAEFGAGKAGKIVGNHVSDLVVDRSTSTPSDQSSDEQPAVGPWQQEEAQSFGHRSTFKRAANILREGFEIEIGDGVMFLESGSGLSPSALAVSGRRDSVDRDIPLPTSPVDQVKTESSFDPFSNAFTKAAKIPSSILAYSTEAEPFLRGSYPAGRSELGQIDQSVLRELFIRYPHGKIWLFSSDITNSLSSSEDDRTSSSSFAKRTVSHRNNKAETIMLARLFPEIKQLIFAPLWDAGSTQWSSACFIWSHSERLIFSRTNDLGFLSSFGKAVMAECSQLDTLLADKQKADFIGSISHELRSPLHGILAGTEFLSDSVNGVFQKSLIGTIEACGRTLLDTINHILDFSKINSLDRKWRSHRQIKGKSAEGDIGPGAQVSNRQIPGGAPPLLRIQAVTDIAAIIEEVVEGLSIGQVYIRAADLTDMSAVNRGQGSEMGMPPQTGISNDVPSGQRGDLNHVEVILDIEREDWVFMAQPGAIRRVVMNLFGNAIKYTTAGSIKVQLRMGNMAGSDGSHRGKLLSLQVSDTGKGISTDFLSSKLFTPFAQEDSLAPGTGLGMSIVRTLTMMMGGTIEVKSKVDEGTNVLVSLPLMRPDASKLSEKGSQDTDLAAKYQGTIQALRNANSNCIVTFHEPSKERSHSASGENRLVLRHYVEEWFGLKVCPWSERHRAQILIMEEENVAEIEKEHLRLAEPAPSVIILCNNASSLNQAEALAISSQQVGIFEYLSKPCGPYKLAKALHLCLSRASLCTSLAQTPNPGPRLVTPSGPRNSLGPGEKADWNAGRGPIDTNLTAPPTSYFFPQDKSEVNSEESIPLPEILEPDPTSPSSSPRPAVPQIRTPPPIPAFHSIPGRAASPAPTSRTRFLCVDDNRINLRLIQTFLRKERYQNIDSAENGLIAVTAVQTAAAAQFSPAYDIIFMDISMPVMNGFDATRAIRALEAEMGWKPALIVAVTGLASARDQEEGQRAGFDAYMTKPLAFRDLAAFLKGRDGDS